MASSLHSAEQIERHRQRLLLFWFAAIGSPFLLGFTIYSYILERWTTALVLGIATLLVAIITFILKVYGKERVVSKCVACLLFALSLYLLLSGGAEGTGGYFAYSLVMLMVLLVGPALGAVFLVAFISAAALLMLSGFEWVYPYTEVQVSRILISTLALFILIYASEWIRIRAYDAITDLSEENLRLALTDPLTGVLNRSGFRASLQTVSFNPRLASLALIDLDHFKKVNDGYGHDAGDTALQEFARITRQNIKGKDLLVRWGGEEFLLLLPQTSLTEATVLLNKLLNEFRQQPIVHNNHEFKLTFSSGVATLQHPDQLDATLKVADQRLYQAKSSGRNRIVAEQEQGNLAVS